MEYLLRKRFEVRKLMSFQKDSGVWAYVEVPMRKLNEEKCLMWAETLQCFKVFELDKQTN